MAKATVTSTRLTPLGVEDFPEPGLAQRSARFWYLLKNAILELWRNRLASVGAVFGAVYARLKPSLPGPARQGGQRRRRGR
jgi:hypothetical protein